MSQKFESDLEAVSASYREQEQASPPELLDQAVLNAARRALPEKRPRRRLGWMTGLATASLATIALTVVLQQAPAPETLPQAQPPTRPATTADATAAQAPEAKQVMKARAAPQAASAERDQAPGQNRDQTAFSASRMVVEEAEWAGSAQADTEYAQQQLRRRESAVSDYDLIEELIPKEEELPTPQQWVDQLQRIHDAGEWDLLEESLDRFRELYPQYPLPPGLQIPAEVEKERDE